MDVAKALDEMKQIWYGIACVFHVRKLCTPWIASTQLKTAILISWIASLQLTNDVFIIQYM